ncbi:MAG: Lrp/AsnC family transcriptional regulator [Candidatus Aenigmarchaeota archaeon]|nr:Lrp/AsnC family transcriptional regulator [Candidatus Aenigmarchaeota archaeon]
MKDIRPRLIELFRKGYCTPQIARIARKLGAPSTTLHYNIKQMEKDGQVKAYKAVFDYKKIGEGFCTYVLINLAPDEYGDPERVARHLARFPQIESVDIATGDWEVVIKVRTKDIDQYYEFVRNVLSMKGIAKVKSLNSLKQIKTEFVEL